MRMFCASVLFFEAIVVGLAIPVALSLTDADPLWSAGASVGSRWPAWCAPGLLGRPWGVSVGWVLQVCVLLTGLVVPAMLVLGVVFGGLWVAALRLRPPGRRDQGVAPGGGQPRDNRFVAVGGPYYGRTS